MLEQVKFNDKWYDTRHGGPFDRGGADSYYSRARDPHYFSGDTYASDRIVPMENDPEWKAYQAGYDYNESLGTKKDWD